MTSPLSHIFSSHLISRCVTKLVPVRRIHSKGETEQPHSGGDNSCHHPRRETPSSMYVQHSVAHSLPLSYNPSLFILTLPLPLLSYPSKPSSPSLTCSTVLHVVCSHVRSHRGQQDAAPHSRILHRTDISRTNIQPVCSTAGRGKRTCCWPLIMSLL